MGAGKRLIEGGVVTLDNDKRGILETIEVGLLEKRGKLIIMEEMPKRVNRKARRAKKKLARKPSAPSLSELVCLKDLNLMKYSLMVPGKRRSR